MRVWCGMDIRGVVWDRLKGVVWNEHKGFVWNGHKGFGMEWT